MRPAGHMLRSGDRMSRADFHRIYEQSPEDFRAELVSGTVRVRGRLPIRHGATRMARSALFASYAMATDGVEAAVGPTVLLGDYSEVEPDLLMRILEERGGQSRITSDDYLEGAPELVLEVAHDANPIELCEKKADYVGGGVREYLVWTIDDGHVYWFDHRGKSKVEVPSDRVIRARSFPGLWIDCAAVMNKDHDRMMATLNKGLATPEHAAFVERLGRAKTES